MLTGNFLVPSLDEDPRDLTLPVLNHDVVTHVLDHLLLVCGPRNQGERVLSLSKLTTYQILPKFYREILLVTPKALCAALDTLECCPHLTSQVQTLHVMVQPLPLFAKFFPGINRLLDYQTTSELTMEEARLQKIVTICAASLQSLAIIGDLFTHGTLVHPVLVCSFTSLTELAVPIHFLFTPNSPFVRRVDFDYPPDNSDPTWPRLRSLWTWISEPPDFVLDEFMVNFRHLGTLRQLALAFHGLYTSDIAVYLSHIQVQPAVECLVIDVAQCAPAFPLPQVVRNGFFFDPRVVFLHPGPFSAPFQRLVTIYTMDSACVIYDLLLVVPVGERPGWNMIMTKVASRRSFAAAHGWIYPEGLCNVVRLYDGPLRRFADQDSSVFYY